MACQLLRYQVQLWEDDLRAERPLRPIIPVVVYHGRTRWQVARTFGALFSGPEPLRQYWPEYRYEVTDLSHLPAEEVRGAVATQLALRVMRSIFEPRLREELPGIVDLLWTPGDRSWTLELLKLALMYVMEASGTVELADLKRAMAGAPPEAQEVDVMTIAETLRQQGRQQGLEQGLEQGLRQGLLNGIELALDVKFGAGGLALMPELAAVTDLAMLQAVSDAIRTAPTVDDVRAVYRRAAA